MPVTDMGFSGTDCSGFFFLTEMWIPQLFHLLRNAFLAHILYSSRLSEQADRKDSEEDGKMQTKGQKIAQTLDDQLVCIS